MDSTRARAKLNAFFASGKELHYKRRSVILNYNETPDMAYWIAKGSVMVVSCNRDGLERIQHIYEEQELFPVKWIFDREQFDVAFFAFTESIIRTRSLTDFTTLIEQEPDVLLAVVRQQLVALAGLINLNLDSAEEKIAFRLCVLAGRFRAAHNNGEAVSCPLTLQELGGSVHVSRETAGKVLNRFEKQGLVSLKRNNIVVYPERLHAAVLG